MSTRRLVSDGKMVRARNLIPGGKSLSGDGSHSPEVKTRVSKDVHARLVERANRDGITPARLMRHAVMEYLDRGEPD
jgi:predicted HicB family RNase H-like nuclease